ncbi:MAG: fumarylacetoacetate hydrolase family protein [Acidobacteria bacterium]|nr:fumarylacetoacetate hydrolase family protein [Acidobacteriota bacterium]
MTRLYRFEHQSRISYGIEQPGENGPDPVLSILAGSPFEPLPATGDLVPLSKVRLLSPCVPTKIVAVGLNYRDHAVERNKPVPAEPMIFLKPQTAVIGHGEDIIYPKMSKRVDYEGEMGVVIGRRTYQLADSDRTDDYILGFTCVNDVTARDLQERDVQYGRAKGFNTFAPIGPAIVSGIDSGALAIETKLNGKVKQSSNTRNLIFNVDYLVRFVSWVMTLEPGDVISTGTPSGIGPMSPGDHVEVTIEKIGTLGNTVMKVREGRT